MPAGLPPRTSIHNSPRPHSRSCCRMSQPGGSWSSRRPRPALEREWAGEREQTVGRSGARIEGTPMPGPKRPDHIRYSGSAPSLLRWPLRPNSAAPAALGRRLLQRLVRLAFDAWATLPTGTAAHRAVTGSSAAGGPGPTPATDAASATPGCGASRCRGTPGSSARTRR